MFHKKACSLLVLIFLLLVKIFPGDILIPVTYFLDAPGHAVRSRQDRALSSFVFSLSSTQNDSLRGIFVADKLQYLISYQPTTDPGFVSTNPDTVTYFSAAANYGSTGLIAHNYLAGSDFFRITESDEISLVNGDGTVHRFLVTEIREYQALSPNSPYSSFVDLANPEKTISYRDLFFETYGVSDRLILQTCISKNNSDSWGRLFIIAIPID
jgi:hypothetical protein